MFARSKTVVALAALLAASSSLAAGPGQAPAAPKGNDIQTIHPKNGRSYLRRGPQYDEGRARLDGYTLVRGHYVNPKDGKRYYRRQHVRALSKPPVKRSVAAGNYLPAIAAQLAAQAKREGRPVGFMANGFLMEAMPGQSAKKVLADWRYRGNHSRKAVYLQKVYARQETRYAKQQQALARELARAPKGALQLNDPKTWNMLVKKNKSRYGKGILSYAQRWAQLMQGEIDKASRSGRPADPKTVLKKHADRLSHLADVEGMSGFSFSMARGTLIRTWAHGDALAAVYGITPGA